jgi:hypothetical protein
VLRDLRPGKHFIRIEQDGYNDWERDVPVIGKKATVMSNTLLIPEQWPIKKVSSRAYQNIFPAAQDVLVATDPILKDIDTYHTSQGIDKGLFSGDSIYADGTLVRLFNAPKSPFILLEALIKDKHKFLWVNLKENPPLIEDISDLFNSIPTRITWDNSNNENIFAFYPNSIYRINIKDKAVFLEDAGRLPEGIGQQSPGTPSDKFLINDKNTLLVREGAQVRIYPKEDFGPPQVYDITKSRPSTNMYFEEKTGELFYLDDATGFLCAAQILPYHPILSVPNVISHSRESGNP